MNRPNDFLVGAVGITLPAFFPSVSSIKTNRTPIDYMKLLVASGSPQFLVSAYDVSRSAESSEMRMVIDSALTRGALILLDSGNYERYWWRDATWTKAQFHAVLKSHNWPAAFSFDVDCDELAAPSDCAERISASGAEDRLCGGHVLYPIVHGNRQNLPSLCSAVAKRSNPVAVAVAERELGDGIFARVATVHRIRTRLNTLGSYYFLHLLGTGNPLSILLYTIAGADTFDGLEWCQTVADPDSKLLLHFQQRELLTTQLQLPGPENYDAATLMHNLLFYAKWMRQLHESLSAGSLSELVRQTMGDAIAAQLRAALRNDGD
ncbi:MAG: hypothetical protein KGL02_06700 [Acidobacteriota bacterium]|nr:hypothetical protein [Acidobacteriota bacterium]MDE3170634.1 hypothetical protein [Acidobacteriota bacterium]